MKLALYTVDHFQRIHALTHDHNAADCFALAIPLCNTFSNIRSKSDTAQIAQQHRSAVLTAHRYVFQVIGRAQITEASNQILRSTQIEHAPAYFIGAGLDSVDHR